MQAIEQSPVQSPTETVTAAPAQVGISIEFVAYAVLLLFAFCVRVADLDTVPLSDLEAMQALPAWHMLYPDAPGTALTSDSPITFWLQAISFTMLGGNEFAARLPGLLGGMLLVLLPLLFRQHIGQERSFLWLLLLACSPIVLLAGRFTQPAIWNAVFALLLIWAVWCYVKSQSQRDMLLAGAAFTGLVFLSGSGGVILAILLGLSALIAVLWTAYSQPEDLELETPGQNIIAQARSLIAGITFERIALLAFLLIFVISTGFMLHPAGLSMVGEIFVGALTGITQPVQSGTAFGSGLWGLFFYNPLLIGMTLVTGITLLRRERMTLFERFLFAWTLLAALMLLLYRGATIGDALWFVLPATALFTSLLCDLFEDRRVFMFWLDDSSTADEDNLPSRFAWVKWITGISLMFMLIMLTVHWGEMARAMQSLPFDTSINDAFRLLMEPAYVEFRYSGIWFLMTLLFMVLIFFLVAIVWGNDHALQGYGLGVFFFMLGSGLGGGWTASVVNAESGTEYWSPTAVTSDMFFLRETLYDLAERETRGFPALNITVLLDETTTLTDSGVLAWALRDFENTRFVTSLEDTYQDEIILLPEVLESPDLGGTYVGQRFVVRHYGVMSTLALLDYPAWLAQRRIRNVTLPSDSMVLWVRQDVFNSIDPEDQ